MNPYIQPISQTQDLSGLQPVFQNMAAQEAMKNALLQQGQAMQPKVPQGSFNPMAMAQALRGQPANPNISSIFNMARYGAGNVYGGFGQGQVPTSINADTWAMGE